MKKLVFILLALALITGCENEPLDPALTGQGQNGDDNGSGGNGSDSDDLSLSLYELDIDLNISFFGFPLATITNSDINIEDDIIVSTDLEISVNDSPFESENQIITRNGNGQITSDISVNSQGVMTNNYQVSYQDGNISQITYDYFEDDLDDYTYNFTYSDNIITRTEVGSSITTEFSIDGFGRVIKKESFDGGFTIQSETLTYTGVGNINTSITTGDVESNVSYSFDDNPNPLRVVYSDNYLLNFLSDDYSDEIGQSVAQFHSTNNWSGADFDGESFTFDLDYNAVGRITNRTISFNSGEDFAIEINESFNYVN